MKSRSLRISIDGIQYDRVLPPNLSIHGRIYRISKRINEINFHLNTKIQVNYSSIVEFDLSLLKAKEYLAGFCNTIENNGDLSKYFSNREMLLLLKVKPEHSMAELLDQKFYEYENVKSGNNNRVKRYASNTIKKQSSYIQFWKDNLLSLTLKEVTYTVISNILLDFVRTHEKKFFEGPSRKYVVDLIKPLKEILCLAKNHSIISKNPFEQLNAFKEIYLRCKDTAKRQNFTIEQVEQILNAAQGEYKNFLIVAFFTGCRSGELIGLRYSDWSQNNHTLSISKTKTQSGIRTIILNPIVTSALEDQWQNYNKGDDFIFHTKTGAPMKSNKNLSRDFKKFLEPLGIYGMTPHGTRHFFASLVAKLNENQIDAYGYLGLKDATMLIRVYQHSLKLSENEPENLKNKISSIEEIKYLIK